MWGTCYTKQTFKKKAFRTTNHEKWQQLQPEALLIVTSENGNEHKIIYPSLKNSLALLKVKDKIIELVTQILSDITIENSE